MSVFGITRLARDLEHEDGLLERFRQDPGAVMDGYALTASECAAIDRLDAGALLDGGSNPVVVRNLFVVLGVAHRDMFTARGSVADTDSDSRFTQ